MASPTIYDRAKVKLVLEEPFFATILLNLNLVETKISQLLKPYSAI